MIDSALPIKSFLVITAVTPNRTTFYVPSIDHSEFRNIHGLRAKVGGRVGHQDRIFALRRRVVLEFKDEDRLVGEGHRLKGDNSVLGGDTTLDEEDGVVIREGKEMAE